MSPILFCLFINELETVLRNCGSRGIQVFPDITEIFSLMFADDVALMSDTVVGLQRPLNALHTFCTDWQLEVNTQKT